jgi:3'(2'), 5'-bisphosphate nucleotidase
MNIAMFDQDKCMQTAVDAVRTAAYLCRNVQSGLTDEFHQKKDKSPVTIADYASQGIICHALKLAFPDIPMIGEEDATELRAGENANLLHEAVKEVHKVGLSVTNNELCDWIDGGGCKTYSPLFWTLDPIDGTKGFLRKEQYAVSLGLIKEGKVVLAVLACPNLNGGKIYTAIAGQGAYVEALDPPHTRTKISVSQIVDFPAVRLCESVESGHSAHDESAMLVQKLGIAGAPVRLDSQAKYAVVAEGSAEAYLRLPTRKDYFEKIWDHAGGVLVVEEAGGKITDVAGKPLEFHHGDQLLKNKGVVVSNGLIHDQLIATLKELGVGQ